MNHDVTLNVGNELLMYYMSVGYEKKHLLEMFRQTFLLVSYRTIEII
jgi:hypothetical protein